MTEEFIVFDGAVCYQPDALHKRMNQRIVELGYLLDAALTAGRAVAAVGAAEMTREIPATEQREALAEYAHEAWAGWMKYMFSRGHIMRAPVVDETYMQVWTMSPMMFERWQRQMNTLYADLPESEKASDRDEADKILAIINARVPSGREVNP